MGEIAFVSAQTNVGDRIMTKNSPPTPHSQGGHEQRYPMLGLIPRSRLGQLFLAWAAINVILALLPVFNIFGNSSELGMSGMPTTVLYSYAVFTLNCILGAAYFLTRGLAWVAINEAAEMENTQ
jgi:hypothetical protein